MLPDMKRLCEAAATVRLGGESVHDTNAQIYERIVRAVLIELRKPTEGIVAACERAEGEAQGYSYFGPDVWTAGIDHILAEPATT